MIIPTPRSCQWVGVILYHYSESATPNVSNPDQIHPDWEAKLAAVQAAAARRANRRIIMRQIGDRLIPVGITSGRIHPLPVEAAGTEGEGGGSRRSRRRQPQQPCLNSFLGHLGFRS